MKVPPPVVLWCLQEGFREVLQRVHGSGKIEIWLIPRWGPYDGEGGWGGGG